MGASKLTSPWLAAALVLGLTACGDDAAPGTDTSPASTSTAVDGTSAPEPAQTPAAAPDGGSPRDLARRLLAASEPQQQYVAMPDPVWRARLALGTALADEPLAALDQSLAAAKERFTGFGAGAKHARVLGQVAVVAHYLDDDDLEIAALDALQALQEDAFDQAEMEGVQAIRLSTLARMAAKPDSSRAAAFEGAFEAMLSGETPQSPAAWEALYQLYLNQPDPDALARMIIHGRPQMDAARATVAAAQRLGWWRSWEQSADIVEAFPDERIHPWQTLARWAVEAELDGHEQAADRLAGLAESRHRALRRAAAEVTADRDAVAWMRANLEVSDPDRAKALFNDNPDITATRREPGTTSLSGLKREVVAAALMRGGFTERGYELANGGRGAHAMPALIFSASADAAMWEAATHFHPRWGMAQQLTIAGTGPSQTGWPDLMASVSRQARDAGYADAADRMLLAAAAAEPHPGTAAVARELARVFSDATRLRAALEQHKGAVRQGLPYRMVSALMLNGQPAEQVMAALGTHRLGGGRFGWDNLHRVPEMGTVLAYGALGVPRLWW